MKLKAVILSLCLLAGFTAYADETSNRAVFDAKVKAFKSWHHLPPGQLLLKVAKSFIGTEYVGGTLEKSPERLVINMDKTDCILFVEMCVALTRTLKSSDTSYENFCDNVRELRYRGGRISGYGSRIHYTSEWIYQAERRGVMTEYTSRYGTPFNQKFSFMTSHEDKYPLMKADPKARRDIVAAQAFLESRNPYYLIDNKSLCENSSYVNDGDIIAFMSGTAGLDIAHVAIACRTKDGRLGFIHASSVRKKVVLDNKSLQEYATRGVRLIRLTM